MEENKVYKLRKRLLKKQKVTNEEFEDLSFKEMRDLCWLLYQDLGVVFDYIKDLKLEIPKLPIIEE